MHWIFLIRYSLSTAYLHFSLVEFLPALYVLNSFQQSPSLSQNSATKMISFFSLNRHDLIETQNKIKFIVNFWTIAVLNSDLNIAKNICTILPALRIWGF